MSLDEASGPLATVESPECESSTEACDLTKSARGLDLRKVCDAASVLLRAIDSGGAFGSGLALVYGVDGGV